MQEIFEHVLGVEINFQEMIQFYALLLARVTPAIFQTPFMGGNLIQGQIKVGISIILVLFLYPLVVPHVQQPLPEQVPLYIMLLVKEFFVGFVMGFLASLPFQYFTSAGSNMDMARGASMGMMNNPGIGEQVTFLANYQYWLMIFLFLAADGHHIYLKILMETFTIIPPTVMPNFGVGFTPFAQQITRLSADTFIYTVQLAAPVLIVMFIIDVVFGLFNRIAAQMNVGELSMILKMLIGLWVYFLSLPVLVRLMYRMLDLMLEFLVKTLTIM